LEIFGTIDLFLFDAAMFYHLCAGRIKHQDTSRLASTGFNHHSGTRTPAASPASQGFFAAGHKEWAQLKQQSAGAWTLYDKSDDIELR